MSTIKLSTAYQLILTALLVGACLGIVSRQLPLIVSTSLPTVSAMVVHESPMATNASQLVNAVPNQEALGLTTNERSNTPVQTELGTYMVEDSSALPYAMGPIDSEMKGDGMIEGHPRASTLFGGELASAVAKPVSLHMAASKNASGGAFSSSTQAPAVPKVVIGAELVNLRSAPALSASVVGQAQAGRQLQIVGRDPTNSWWLVCCLNDRLVWVSAHVVSTFGNLSDITVISTDLLSVSGRSNVMAREQHWGGGELASPTASLAQPLDVAAEIFPYQLVQQRQHSEQIIPRLFLFVSDKAVAERDEGIPNLGMLVKKDGILLSTPQRTHGGQPDLTWPTPHTRQQLANLKIEFPGIDPIGHWEVQLIDASGRPIGPVAHFVFAPSEPNMEMYLHYQK